jgi:hypothetical protein
VTARNWQGVIFSQLPPLEVTREARLEFVRAFRFLNAANIRLQPTGAGVILSRRG